MDIQIQAAEMPTCVATPGAFVFVNTDDTLEIHGDHDERLAWLRMVADALNATVELRDPGPNDAERFHEVLDQVGLRWTGSRTHAFCSDALCNICRGDTHVIGPNPDTLDPTDTGPTFARLMALLPKRDGSTRLTSDGL